MVKKHTPRAARKAVKRLEDEGRPVRFRHDWRYLCGTLYEMPIEPNEQDLIQAAEAAVHRAQQTRKLHARRSKRSNKQRQADLRIALELLADAMRPIRRLTAKLSYRPLPLEDDLREASKALQRERRKIWKMSRPKTRRN